MLPLLRKKSDAAAAPLVPVWHPNFRNYERLPDVKVVRTAFFVNGAAIAIALGLLVFFASREYELHALRAQIAEVDEQIARDKRGSDEAVALYRKFQEQEKKVREVDTFLKSKPVVSELLVRFSETRPADIALTLIEFREAGINLRGLVRGSPDTASGEASKYTYTLGDDPILGPLVQEPQLTSLSRDASSGRLHIEVALRFKPAKKP